MSTSAWNVFSLQYIKQIKIYISRKEIYWCIKFCFIQKQVTAPPTNTYMCVRRMRRNWKFIYFHEDINRYMDKINIVKSIFKQSIAGLSLGLQNTPTASLQRDKTPPHNEFPVYDSKQSDVEVPVMLDVWGMGSTSSLPSLLGPLRPGVVGLDRVLSMVKKKLKCVLMLNWIIWNRAVLIYEMVTRAKLNCLK